VSWCSSQQADLKRAQVGNFLINNKGKFAIFALQFLVAMCIRFKAGKSNKFEGRGDLFYSKTPVGWGDD
jgi:hypothetical protein